MILQQPKYSKMLSNLNGFLYLQRDVDTNHFAAVPYKDITVIPLSHIIFFFLIYIFLVILFFHRQHNTSHKGGELEKNIVINCIKE